MTDSKPSSFSNKRRKLEGPSFAVSTPTDPDDEPPRKSATPTIQVPYNQDPQLLHHLDGHRIIRRSHTPFTSGGFCDIFIGDHPIYGKVAMRRPRMTVKGYTLSEMESFYSESEIWKKLCHPNILQFIGLIQSDGNIWAVSRFAENGSLTTYLDGHPGTDRRIFVLQLADAIRYLHRQGVVHGDIKGSNVLISAAVTVLLCDFGLSKPSGTATRSSLSGAGSSRWCAPELLFDEATKTCASDVYAFGMTVYEILSGNVPYHELGNEVLVIKAINEGRKPPREPTAPESGDPYEPLWNVASDSWDGNPSKRPTMEAVCERLGVPVNSPLTTTLENISAVESTELHSLSSTSAVVVNDAEYRLARLRVNRVANHGERNTMIQHSNMRGEGVITDPLMQTSRGIGWRTENESYHSGISADERLIVGIPRAHARYDDTATKPSRPCHQGTRTDLLTSITHWIDDDFGTNEFFWLCGEVGVGKTTVAHTIAKAEDARHQLGGSFFFNRDTEERRHPGFFATTIAYQLSRFDPEAYQAVANVLRPDPDVVHRQLAEQVQKLVVQPLRIRDSSGRKVVLVVDGLDECSNPALILDVLLPLTRHTGLRLRVLVTSRPHAAIMTKFHSPRLCHLTSQTRFRDINPEVLESDVRAYLEWALGDIAAEYSLPFPWPSPHDVDKLIGFASRLFVLASIYDRYIRDPTEGDPSGQLERVLSRKTIGGSPTAELDSMYDLVLNDVKEWLSESHSDMGFSRSLLQLVLLSRKAMSMIDISCVLGCTTFQVRSVLRRMTSVITLPNGEGDYITAFHASFGEYIQDATRCSVREFLIDPTSSHAELAVKYLGILIRAAEDGITGLEYEVLKDAPREITMAALQLPYHLSLVPEPVPIQLQEAREKFCLHAIWTWVFVWHMLVPIESISDDTFATKLKEAGLATALNPDGDESLYPRLIVKRILDGMPHLSMERSSPFGGTDGTKDEGNRIPHEGELEVFKIGLEEYPRFGGCALQMRDPRNLARRLYKWSKFDHPNIMPLVGINFQSLQEQVHKREAVVYVPLTSHYPTLRRDWYPSLVHAFQQNAEVAVKTVLCIASAIQYLLELAPDRVKWLKTYESDPGIWDLRIEDIVLSKEGDAKLHPLFLVHRNDERNRLQHVDPSPVDEERKSWERANFVRWDSLDRYDTPSNAVWRFGCVFYEMMTGSPPLKHYYNLVMADKLSGHEELDGERNMDVFKSLIKRKPDSFDVAYPHLSDLDLDLDMVRQHYQTAVYQLLNDLNVSEDLKNILQACWEVEAGKRPRIQEIVARLTGILEVLQSQNTLSKPPTFPLTA